MQVFHLGVWFNVDASRHFIHPNSLLDQTERQEQQLHRWAVTENDKTAFCIQPQTVPKTVSQTVFVQFEAKTAVHFLSLAGDLHIPAGNTAADFKGWENKGEKEKQRTGEGWKME